MKSFHQTKAPFLSTFAAAILLITSGQLSAQESTLIPLIPFNQTPVAVPDSTVPPATEDLQIPQEVPLSVPQIQPVNALQQAPPTGSEPTIADPAATQNPPAPLPQLEAELPPVNADEMADEDRDDLLRGPVHEAYAEQLNADPVAGLVIPQKPPEAVEEVAPELKPDGRQVEWISGYWAWDEDQDDFIWVSGIWREVPQGFRWLPGYWTEVEGGYQWVNGTWVSNQTEEITYLNDAPPETLEQGPVGNSPSEQHIWIPGTWMWTETRYAWRPGYWSTGYENWIWVPARYQWTPRGYYQCDGYWDYPVQRRGVLFAPAHFHRRFRPNRITRFTPRVVVASNLLTVHFWVRPRYRHYYFGDYYNVGFANRGLTPWHQFPRQRRCFDPLYAHYGRGRRSNDYYNQLNVQFNVFVNQPNRRPPIRFRDQDRWARDHRDDFRPNDFLGNRFQNVVENASRNRDGFQFVRLENQQREQVQQETRRLRELVDQRRDVERSLAQLERSREQADDRRDSDRGADGRGQDGLNSDRDQDGEGIDLRDRLRGGSDREGDNVAGDDRGREKRDRARDERARGDNVDDKSPIDESAKDGLAKDGTSKEESSNGELAKGDDANRDRGNRGRDKDGSSGEESAPIVGDKETNGGLTGEEIVGGDRRTGDRKDRDRGDRGQTVEGNGVDSRDGLNLPPETEPGKEVARDGERNNGREKERDVVPDLTQEGKGRDGSTPDTSKGDATQGDVTREDMKTGDTTKVDPGNGTASQEDSTKVDAARDDNFGRDDRPRGDRPRGDNSSGDGSAVVTEEESKNAPNNDSSKESPRERRDRLKLDPPNVDSPKLDSPSTDGSALDGSNVDKLPNRDAIRDKMDRVEEQINDRRDRAEKSVRESVDRVDPRTDGTPATNIVPPAGNDERPKLELPKMDDVQNKARDVENRIRDKAPSLGTGTDNSATAGGDAVGGPKSAREIRRDRLKLPAVDKPVGSGPGIGTTQPNVDAGAKTIDAIRGNQTSNEGNATPRGENDSRRPTARERLKLPPATRPGKTDGDNLNGGSTAGAPADGSSGANTENSRGNRNIMESIRNARSQADANKVDVNKPDGNPGPAVRGRDQNPPAETPATGSRRIDRTQNRPAPAGNPVDNGAADSAPRSEARSRANSGSRIAPPSNGNVTGEDKSPRMRLDASPPRDAAREPAREPAVRNIPPQRDRSPASGANPGPSAGSERASRRETAPRVDTPPASSGRVRGSEARSNPGNAGGGDGGAAREPRNNPSMGSPRGGDAGGGRASRPDAGRSTPDAGAARGGAGGRRESGGGGAAGGGRRGREK